MDRRISSDESDSMMSGFETDLNALFRMMERDVNELMAKGLREGWTPEKIVHEIDKLLGETDVTNKV